MTNSSLRVSVVIAAWPDATGLSNCLGALEAQRDEQMQVIAVLTTQPPAELVRRFDWVQWADPATIWAVQSLSERLASSPAGWVLAARREVSAAGANRLLDRLAAAGAARIELGPAGRAVRSRLATARSSC